jgi:hypothetical protein
MVKAETGQNATAIGISLLMASNFLRGRLQTLQEVMGQTFITEDKISVIHMSQIGACRDNWFIPGGMSGELPNRGKQIQRTSILS